MTSNVFVPQTLNVLCARGSYSVEFASPNDSTAWSNILKNKTHCVVDANVARLHANTLAPIASRMPVFEFEATEKNKSWEGALRIIQFLANNGGNRKSHVLVIGGGITQDTCAFACHIFHRGVAWTFVPTTLLAMSDSCIGGKAALNVDGTKNQVGVFDTPQHILIQTKFLSTLPENDLRSGFGELVKMHLLVGENEYDRLEESIQRSGFSANNSVLQAVHTSLEAKKSIVEADEFENDRRKLLNYGHTFGHALESLTNYAIPHGHAVAWGMDCVNHIAMRRGWISEAWTKRVHLLLQSGFPIPQNVVMPNAQDLVKTAKRDKKSNAADVDLVVMHRPGEFALKPFALDGNAVSDVKMFLEAK